MLDVRMRNITGTPGVNPKSVPVPQILCRSFGYGHGRLAELIEIPGTGMEVLQNSQKFRVRYGYLTELTEVPGRYTNVVAVPRVLWHRRTEHTEVRLRA